MLPASSEQRLRSAAATTRARRHRFCQQCHRLFLHRNLQIVRCDGCRLPSSALHRVCHNYCALFFHSHSGITRCGGCRSRRSRLQPPSTGRACLRCERPMPTSWRLLHCRQCRQILGRHLNLLPLAFAASAARWQPLILERMDVECPYCAALHWEQEIAGIQHGGYRSYPCCRNGSVQLDPMPEPPPVLRQLFTSNTSQARAFRHVIRPLNTALAYTLMSYTADSRLHTQTELYLPATRCCLPFAGPISRSDACIWPALFP
jgi:hypothetical protein